MKLKVFPVLPILVKLENQPNQQIIQVTENIDGYELSHMVEFPLLTVIFNKILELAGSNIQFDEGDQKFQEGHEEGIQEE